MESELSDFKLVLSTELPKCDVLKETNILVCLDLCIKGIIIRTNFQWDECLLCAVCSFWKIGPTFLHGKNFISGCGVLMHYINANMYKLKTKPKIKKKKKLWTKKPTLNRFQLV